MGGGGAAPAGFDAALERRQALMGKSGPRALVKNFKVFRIALFASWEASSMGITPHIQLGKGQAYTPRRYNQGMFSGILAMPSFGKRMIPSVAVSRLFCANQ